MISPALVVTPTYNEVANLAEVVERTFDSGAEIDLLVVDDRSPDGTGLLAAALARDRPGMHVLHRDRKRGLGSAYRAGLGWGLDRGYEVLLEMDADLSHHPGDLPRLLAAAERADVVIGSRYVPGGAVVNWPWHRRALSLAGNRYVRAVTGLGVRDATSGYRAYRRAVLEAIDLRHLSSDGYAFQVETALRAWRAGFVIQEVPITFVERRLGASKISRRIVLEALWRVLVWGVGGPRRQACPHPDSVAAVPGRRSG